MEYLFSIRPSPWVVRKAPGPFHQALLGERTEEPHAKAEPGAGGGGRETATLRRGPESPPPILVARTSGSPSTLLRWSTACLTVQGLPVMGDVCIVTPVPPVLGDGPSFTFQLLWPPVIMHNPDPELLFRAEMIRMSRK